MTGRPSAPNNIAYDDLGREFVYRQPANEPKFAGIMSADSEEVFSCYRFDGLERWTVPAVEARQDDHSLTLGWLKHCLANENDHLDRTSHLIRDRLQAAHRYLTGDQFHIYLKTLKKFLRDRDGDAQPTTTS